MVESVAVVASWVRSHFAPSQRFGADARLLRAKNALVLGVRDANDVGRTDLQLQPAFADAREERHPVARWTLATGG